MQYKNILIAGPYEEEFNRQLPTNFQQAIRFVPVDEVTNEDLLWADIYVGSKPSPNFHFENIKWVHSFNAGVNNFLELEGWAEQDVLLTRTICSFGQRISEYCLSYVLRELQYQPYFEKKQLEKIWARKTPKMIKDQTIVIFGTGEIGQEVARTFSQFGARVYGVSQSGKQKEFFYDIVTPSRCESYVSEADWIISTLPLTEQTSGMFNQKLFSYFNQAVFLNVGRGATVIEADLIQALNERKVRQAVLDVFSTEPLPVDSELWERKDVIITPHISAVTDLDEAITCFFDTLKKVENGEELSNKVNFSKGY